MYSFIYLPIYDLSSSNKIRKIGKWPHYCAFHMPPPPSLSSSASCTGWEDRRFWHVHAHCVAERYEAFLKWGYSPIIHFNEKTHYKQSILVYPHLWKPGWFIGEKPLKVVLLNRIIYGFFFGKSTGISPHISWKNHEKSMVSWLRCSPVESTLNP